MKIAELKCMKEQVQQSVSEPIFKPDCQLDYLERVAILVVDGGVDTKVANIQAAEEIQARYGPDCVAVIQEQV